MNKRFGVSNPNFGSLCFVLLCVKFLSFGDTIRGLLRPPLPSVQASTPVCAPGGD